MQLVLLCKKVKQCIINNKPTYIHTYTHKQQQNKFKTHQLLLWVQTLVFSRMDRCEIEQKENSHFRLVPFAQSAHPQKTKLKGTAHQLVHHPSENLLDHNVNRFNNNRYTSFIRNYILCTQLKFEKAQILQMNICSVKKIGSI